MVRYTRMRSSSATWIAYFTSSKWWTITAMCIWRHYFTRCPTRFVTNWLPCPSTASIPRATRCARRPGGSISAGRRQIPMWAHCICRFVNFSNSCFFLNFLALLFALSPKAVPHLTKTSKWKRQYKFRLSSLFTGDGILYM